VSRAQLSTTGFAVVWLAFVWVLLWGTLSWANVLGGLVVALLVRWLLPLPTVVPEGRVSPVGVAVLLVSLGRELVVSSAQVAWLAVRPGPAPPTAVVAVRLETDSDLLLAIVVNALNLMPGSMVLEIDQVERVVYSHAIDVADDAQVEAYRDSVRRMEHLVQRAFPARRADTLTATQDGDA
jgi:multicomponent Na+:H+ antiporter subunit E